MSTSQLPPFHLAFPVDDLAAAKTFYCDLIGCGLGRSSDHWIDFNMFGHQIVAHQHPAREQAIDCSSAVDGKDVPIPHFGLVLAWDEWHQLSSRLTQAAVEFIIEPYIRFEGQTGEQATMFFRDPSGNALEFKAFRDPGQLFAT